MYIGEHGTYIGFYLIAAIVGLAVGQFVDWIIERLLENKKVFSRDIFRKYKIEFKPNYILMIITSLIYCCLIYKLGIQSNFIGNIDLIKYTILTPMLLAALVIDHKKQILPNRLTLTMFEVGLVITFLCGFSQIAISIEMLLGMIVGVAIFLIITLIGYLFYGKDSMGLGDIKFIAALGLYFGVTNIIVISIMAFLIATIYAVIMILSKRKKVDEYIPFGPFIVIAAFISIFVKVDILIYVLKEIFTLGMYKK